jgi:hypothetical protein
LVCQSDESPLILIAKVELLDSFLASTELEVAVPSEVARECCDVKKTLDALMIQKAIDEARIKAKIVKNKKSSRTFERVLEEQENEILRRFRGTGSLSQFLQE